MTAGRPATPTHIKKLTGNPGKRKMNAHEPTASSAPPRPPSSITPGALVAWKRLIDICPGLYTAADEIALMALCEFVTGHWEATAMVAQQGRYCPGSTGQMTIAPWVIDQQRCAEGILKYASKFGLTPSDRAKLAFPEKPPESKFSGLLGAPKR